MPLLFTGTALVYMLLAIPVGRIADRLGRRWVFIGGYVLLLPVYGSLLLPAVAMARSPTPLSLVGCYYAATDGVLMALASSMLPRGCVVAALHFSSTATSLTRLLASVILGVYSCTWGWI